MAWFGGGGGNWGSGFGNVMGGLGDRLRAGGRAMGGGQGMAAGNPYTQGTGGAYGRGSGGGYMGGGGGTAGEYAGIHGYGAYPGGQPFGRGGFQQAPGNMPQPILRPHGSAMPVQPQPGGGMAWTGGTPNFDERTGQYRPGTGPVGGGRGQPMMMPLGRRYEQY